MLQDKRTERKVIEVEPIIYTLSHVKTGVIRHDDDDINTATTSLYTDGVLWTVIIAEDQMMSAKPDFYRATDEIRHQAVTKACIRANEAKPSRSYNVNQIYEALEIQVLPGGIMAE